MSDSYDGKGFNEAHYFNEINELEKPLAERIQDNSPFKKERTFLMRNADLHDVMNGRMTHEISKNFESYYNQYLIKNPSLTQDDFDEWIIAMHSHMTTGDKPLLDQIVQNNGTLDRLEIYFKEPYLFSPWQAGFETANSFGNCARGRLLQFHEAKHGSFKDMKNLDVVVDGRIIHSIGLDFKDPANPGRFIEMKTTAAGKVDHLRRALQKSVEAIKLKDGSELLFKIFYLESNGKPNMELLNKQLIALRGANPKITIQPIELIPSAYKPY